MIKNILVLLLNQIILKQLIKIFRIIGICSILKILMLLAQKIKFLGFYGIFGIFYDFSLIIFLILFIETNANFCLNPPLEIQNSKFGCFYLAQDNLISLKNEASKCKPASLNC